MCDNRVHLYLSETTEFICSGSAALEERGDSRGHRVTPSPHTETKTKDSVTQAAKVIQIYICICKICTNLRPRAHRRKPKNASAEYENNKMTESLDQQRQRGGTEDLNNISHRDGISSSSFVKSLREMRRSLKEWFS